LTSIDKANVLETSRLWRSVVERINAPGISRGELRAYAGGCGRHASPEAGRANFDVIVTENMSAIFSPTRLHAGGSLGFCRPRRLG